MTHEFKSPETLEAQGKIYKKAMEITEPVTIYIKPKAWYIPHFLYKAIIKDHVLIVNKKENEETNA